MEGVQLPAGSTPRTFYGLIVCFHGEFYMRYLPIIHAYTLAWILTVVCILPIVCILYYHYYDLVCHMMMMM